MEREDSKSIFELGKEHFGSPAQYSWDWNVQKVEEYANREYGSGIVCLNQKIIVGFCLAQNRYSEQRPDVAWLTYIIINSEFKGRGIGRELSERVTASLKQRGVREVITDVYEDNAESLGFFAKQGFEIKERWFILAKKI